MRAAGERHQLQPRDAGLAGEHLPARLRRPAALEIDALARLVLPVGRERQIDEPAVARDIAPDAGDVVFLDRAGARTGRRALASAGLSKARSMRPGGIFVEPVHDLGRAAGPGSAPGRALRGNRRARDPCRARSAARSACCRRSAGRLRRRCRAMARRRAIVEGRGQGRHRRAYSRIAECGAPLFSARALGVQADAEHGRGPAGRADTHQRRTAMAARQRLGVGIIGAGNISSQYLQGDAGLSRARYSRHRRHEAGGGRAQGRRIRRQGRGSVDDLLADPGVDIIVNLTIPRAHVEVGLQGDRRRQARL